MQIGITNVKPAVRRAISQEPFQLITGYLPYKFKSGNPTRFILILNAGKERSERYCHRSHVRRSHVKRTV